MEQQLEASTLGMWVFLVTEIMFFGGLFMAYLVYRWPTRRAFQEASEHLNMAWGGVNTVVLIVSSLTMALAVRAAQTSAKPKTQVGWLVATMIFGAAFLGVKVIEYTDKFAHHLVPGPHFQWTGQYPAGAEIFYSLYFCMTGLHAVHMIIGLGIMTVIAVMAWRGKFDADYYTPVEVVRPLLALRRHRLDLPVPAAVPDRRALRRGSLRQSCLVTSHRREVYYLVFARADRRHGPDRTLAALVDFGVLQQRRHARRSRCAKAPLVILFFMHVRWSSRLTWVVAASGFFWLLILFGITMIGLPVARLDGGSRSLKVQGSGFKQRLRPHIQRSCLSPEP